MAGIFQPTLQTQVQPEKAVADSSAATAINALTDVASGFFRSQQASKGSGPTYKQAKLEQFSNDLNRLQQLSETDGISRNRLQADLSLAARQVASLEVPEALRVQYENLSGSPFEAFSYDDPEEFQKNQLLKSDFAQGIRPSVITQIEAEGGVVTPEAVDAAVLAKVEEKNLLDNQVEIQRQNRALGRPVQTTPILESIQSDYQVLLDAVKGAQADNIVEQAEYRSLQTSVNNLIATKYTGFETNPEINGVIQQMNGLLNDIGKGVSSTPSAVLADTIQVALQSKGFSTSTIAIARAQLEQNPEAFQTNFGTNEKGETVADALVAILEDAGTGKSLVDIFDTNTAPERPVVAGEKPAAMDIPSVSENPEAYQQVVDKLSQSAATTDPNTLLGNTEARNSWLTTMNIVGSAVKSQSDEFILGEKLLSMFASNGVVKNLDAVYRTDPANAVQTNSILQEGLAAERVRQRNELDQRLNTGDGEYFKVDQSGKVVFDMDFIEGKFAGASLGERRLASLKETIGRIDEVGGLEAFMRLPDAARNEVLQGSGLEGIVTTRFGKTLKLVSNLRMIDTKLGNLQDLATKYQDDTNLFAGKPEGTAEETGGAATLDIDQLSGQDTQSLIKTAESVLGLNENKQTDILANFLSAGGVEIDPSQTAWCAAFVNATLSKTGLDGTGALNARSFLDWGSEVTAPQLGDVVVLSRGDNPAQGHVGFFKGFDADGNILILGGNQGDAVSVQSFNKDRLLGYRRPEGVTGIGTEAGLSQAVYKAATDPSFLPSPVPATPVQVEQEQPDIQTEVSSTPFAQTTTGSARAAGQQGRAGLAGDETNALDAMAADRLRIDPDLQALLDSLSGASDEEKQRIVDFLGE